MHEPSPEKNGAMKRLLLFGALSVLAGWQNSGRLQTDTNAQATAQREIAVSPYFPDHMKTPSGLLPWTGIA
jgi:hypothetical protein